jgi:hypothetical protein
MILREYDVDIQIDDLDSVVEDTLYQDLSQGKFDEDYLEESEEESRLDDLRERSSDVLDPSEDE